MAEGGGLLNRYTVLKPYLGFESPPLRQSSFMPRPRTRSTVRGRTVKGAMWHVYIVRCRDGSLYTGIASDLAGRLAVHNAGRGAKYTRSRLPVRLVHFERYRAKGRALSREAEIKRLPRRQKIRLVSG